MMGLLLVSLKQLEIGIISKKMNNEQGALGETLFNVAISRGLIFRPRELGDKWPTSDFYIELIGRAAHNYFLVQVKSSRNGLNKEETSIRITAQKKKLNKLKNYFAPTYLAAVDIETEKVFLKPISKYVKNDISSLKTTFELTAMNRKKLYKDVKLFWKSSRIKKFKSKFKHSI